MVFKMNIINKTVRSMCYKCRGIEVEKGIWINKEDSDYERYKGKEILGHCYCPSCCEEIVEMVRGRRE